MTFFKPKSNTISKTKNLLKTSADMSMLLGYSGTSKEETAQIVSAAYENERRKALQLKRTAQKEELLNISARLDSSKHELATLEVKAKEMGLAKSSPFIWHLFMLICIAFPVFAFQQFNEIVFQSFELPFVLSLALLVGAISLESAFKPNGTKERNTFLIAGLFVFASVLLVVGIHVYTQDESVTLNLAVVGVAFGINLIYGFLKRSVEHKTATYLEWFDSFRDQKLTYNQKRRCEKLQLLVHTLEIEHNTLKARVELTEQELLDVEEEIKQGYEAYHKMGIHFEKMIDQESKKELETIISKEVTV